MEWSDLRVFLAIAREGTLGAAARKLGQTQPTMGRRLRALEEAVGQTLFQRTGEGFVLTDEGTSVLGHAERIEEEALASSASSPAGDAARGHAAALVLGLVRRPCAGAGPGRVRTPASARRASSC